VVLAEGVTEIRILKRQGLSVREIARRTGHSRNTVERYLKREGNPVYAALPVVPGKLDAYKAFLSARMIAAHPERLPSTVLLGELRARGYTGGITILREHLAALQPVLPVEPVVRFKTKPEGGAASGGVDVSAADHRRDRLLHALLQQPAVHVDEACEFQPRFEEPAPHDADLVLDLTFLPPRGWVAGRGLHQIVTAHLGKAPIKLPLTTDQQRVHRRAHVIVDAALTGVSVERERLVMSVEHHLLRLPRIAISDILLRASITPIGRPLLTTTTGADFDCSSIRNRTSAP
jgi:transcriptional regulator with XRE-family HTH domain